MPTSTPKPTAGRAKPATFTGSADVNATIDRVAPSVLALLADGMPRTKGVIVAALAGRHGAEAVALALIRLSVTGELEQTGSKYTLATAGGAGPLPAAPRGLSWSPCASRRHRRLRPSAAQAVEGAAREHDEGGGGEGEQRSAARSTRRSAERRAQRQRQSGPGRRAQQQAERDAEDDTAAVVLVARDSP
jgi:hypothetical protein